MTEKRRRVSSTQISTFQACPQKWARIYVENQPNPVGRAAHIGTVFHAIVEFYLTRSFFPSYAAVASLPGNYSPTRDALLVDGAGIYAIAMRMAKFIHAEGVLDGVLDGVGAIHVERALDDFGVRLGAGTLAGGYLDVLHLDPAARRATITDWKTRGKLSWSSRPRSSEAFEANAQMTYYAAALALSDAALNTVEVRHVNVLRADQGGPAVSIDAHVFDTGWLRAEVVPELDRIVRAMEEIRDGAIPVKDRGACFQYGPCPFLTACATGEMIIPQDGDFFANLAAAQILGVDK